MKKSTFRKSGLLFCLLLSGCDTPLLFWEEEGRKVIDDFVEEEEKLHPAPAPAGEKKSYVIRKTKRRIVKRPLQH